MKRTASSYLPRMLLAGAGLCALLLPPAPVSAESQANREAQIAQERREEARRQKDYARADDMRRKLHKRGFLLEDSDTGPVVKALRHHEQKGTA